MVAFRLASLDTIQGEYTRACALLEESIVLFREQGNKIGLAWSLYSLAQVRLESQADPAIVHSLLEESLALWRSWEIQGVLHMLSFSQGR